MAICGPVEGGTIPVMSNIPHWGSISEDKVSIETGIKNVKFLNDFVANGYGILSLSEQDLECYY